MTVLKILLAVLLIVFLYGGWIVLWAYVDVRNAPREPMLMCPKHGPIRTQGTIEFFGTRYCGLCFHQKLRDAERQEIH